MRLKLGKYYGSIKVNLLIGYLYCKNSVLFRRLKLVEFDCLDSIIIKGNAVRFHVNVKGCHKIVINDSVVIPGNTSAIMHRVLKHSERLTFTFYGKGGKLLKTMILEANDVSINHPFVLNASTDLLFSESNLCNDIITTVTERLATAKFSSEFGLENLEFNARLDDLSIHNLDTFNLEEYKPLNRQT